MAQPSKAGASAKSSKTGRAAPAAKRGAAPAKAAAKTAPKGPAKAASKPRVRAARRRLPSLPRLFPERAARPIRTGLSLDRKLDILGIVLVMLGLGTTLALLSPVNSALVGAWVQFWERLFGWGVTVFPLGLMLSGAWLMLRNFERIPQLALERLVGFLLTYLNLLAVLHFLIAFAAPTTALALGQAGRGGGLVGGWIFTLLYDLLGVGGAAIVLMAWLVIALALTLDLTVADGLRRLLPLVEQARAWQRRRQTQAQVAAALGAHALPTAAVPPPLQTANPGVAVSGHPALTADAAAPPPPPLWVLPTLAEILDSGSDLPYDAEVDRQRAAVIEETLVSLGAPARVVEINPGPTITQFGVEPDFIEQRGGRMRVRVGKIAGLADDLALALSARTVRVQAPVPGKGYIGIEVPNDKSAVVTLRDVIESEAFTRLKSPLRFALGENVSGTASAADLAAMPHLLIAGATGSGKSVCVNAIICCLLMNNTPDDLRLIMVDPKRVELTGYDGIPHLLAPVVVDLEKVVAALQWVTREMDLRYRKLSDVGARNIVDYNAKVAARGEKKMPYLVVIIDELADLMMLAPDDTERTITRLAQMARATGIHLVIATQRPSVDVVTGLIKANFPSRIAFAVASGVDSRVILDQPGAERLLGRGDMLFMTPEAPAPLRLQGVYVSDQEINRLVRHWQNFAGAADLPPAAAGSAVTVLPTGVPLMQGTLWDEGAPSDEDPLLREAIAISREQGRASASMLQRRLQVGYNRATRLIEAMEAKGIVSPPEGAGGARAILDYGAGAPPIDES